MAVRSTDAHGGAIEISSRQTISLSPPSRETRLAIRKADWNRLRRLHSSKSPRSDLLRIAYSALFGMGASAGLSVYPLAAQPVNSWIVPLYVCVTVFSILVAFILIRLDWHFCKTLRAHRDLIDADMDEIEASFTDAVPIDGGAAP